MSTQQQPPSQSGSPQPTYPDPYPLKPLPPVRSNNHSGDPTSQTLTPSTDRLSIPPAYRVLTSAMLGGAIGACMGGSAGGTMSGLRFRAENSHRLPTSTRGWYFYHKTKNYVVALGGMRDARRASFKLGFWTGLFVAVEDMFDVVRRARARRTAVESGRPDDVLGRPGVDIPYGQDMFSSVGAGLVTAGYFSLWNRLRLGAAVKMLRMGVLGGVAYGALQDVGKLLQGRRLGYVERLKAALGLAGPADEMQSV